MSEAKILKTFLATDGEPLALEVVATQPEFETLQKQRDSFRAEAMRIEQALMGSLPGGLYDQLLGAMLERKATHFIVRHRDA